MGDMKKGAASTVPCFTIPYQRMPCSDILGRPFARAYTRGYAGC